jgi:hypothetical protein
VLPIRVVPHDLIMGRRVAALLVRDGIRLRIRMNRRCTHVTTRGSPPMRGKEVSPERDPAGNQWRTPRAEERTEYTRQSVD